MNNPLRKDAIAMDSILEGRSEEQDSTVSQLQPADMRAPDKDQQQDSCGGKLQLADIYKAHDKIKSSIVHTPCLRSETLSQISGADVWIKFENLQFTASFKERGALNKLLSLPSELRRKGVVAMSAGNHAQGVAYNGNRLGIPTTIVMPKGTPTVKIQQTEGHNATVILHGETVEEAYMHAQELAKKRGLTFVHPFDDPLIIAGQGTLAVEMLEDVPDLEALIIPIGGGGLISGVAIAARALKPDIEIIGVQSELYPAVAAAIKGYSANNAGGDTLAEGIAVKQPGELTTRTIMDLVDDTILVSEDMLEKAVAMLLAIEKTVAEGAGAASLAALLSRPHRFRGKKVGIILSGGNIDSRLLANVLMRDLVREGRLARLRVCMQDRAGALYKLTKIFDEEGVNIVNVSHQHVFTNLPAKGTYAELEVETRDRGHLERLVDSIRNHGYDVNLIETL